MPSGAIGTQGQPGAIAAERQLGGPRAKASFKDARSIVPLICQCEYRVAAGPWHQPCPIAEIIGAIPAMSGLKSDFGRVHGVSRP
jgi:hypothetical protein